MNVANTIRVVGSRLVGNQVDAEDKEEENRRSCEFKARPLHIADEDWQTIQNRQIVRRKQRNQMRKQMVSDIPGCSGRKSTLQEFCCLCSDLNSLAASHDISGEKQQLLPFADVVDVSSAKTYGYA